MDFAIVANDVRISHRNRSRSPCRSAQLKDLLHQIQNLEIKKRCKEQNDECPQVWTTEEMDVFLTQIRQACGYPHGQPINGRIVGEDFGCSLFVACSRSGRNLVEQNRHYSIENQIEMALDTLRISAFETAIRRVANGKRVLDVGSGAFCMLGRIALKAGAISVCTVEQNELAVQHAVELFKMELADVDLAPLQCLKDTCGALDSERMQLSVSEVGKVQHIIEMDDSKWAVQVMGSNSKQQSKAGASGATSVDTCLNGCQMTSSDISPPPGARPSCASRDDPSLKCKVLLWPHKLPTQEGEDAANSDSDQSEKKQFPSVLEVRQGLSGDVKLQGPYDLVVHELLGHIASSEGVAPTLVDLVDRDLIGANCLVIPKAAGTFVAPVEEIHLSTLEHVLSGVINGCTQLVPQTRYNVLRFDQSRLLAKPALFEWLNFYDARTLRGDQQRKVEFTTIRDGVFDGLHFHLSMQLDDSTTIDTISTETTWSTMYVRFLDRGIWLPAGSRIVCQCCVSLGNVEGMSGQELPSYSISIGHGGPEREVHLGDFSWKGA